MMRKPFGANRALRLYTLSSLEEVKRVLARLFDEEEDAVYEEERQSSYSFTSPQKRWFPPEVSPSAPNHQRMPGWAKNGLRTIASIGITWSLPYHGLAVL